MLRRFTASCTPLKRQKQAQQWALRTAGRARPRTPNPNPKTKTLWYAMTPMFNNGGYQVAANPNPQTLTPKRVRAGLRTSANQTIFFIRSRRRRKKSSRARRTARLSQETRWEHGSEHRIHDGRQDSWPCSRNLKPPNPKHLGLPFPGRPTHHLVAIRSEKGPHRAPVVGTLNPKAGTLNSKQIPGCRSRQRRTRSSRRRRTSRRLNGPRLRVRPWRGARPWRRKWRRRRPPSRARRVSPALRFLDIFVLLSLLCVQFSPIFEYGVLVSYRDSAELPLAAAAPAAASLTGAAGLSHCTLSRCVLLRFGWFALGGGGGAGGFPPHWRRGLVPLPAYGVQVSH